MAAAEAPLRCFYETLGIELSATAREIRAAYRTLALKHHPDKAVQNGVSKEQATARFQEIIHAYEILYRLAASSSSAEKWDFVINLRPYFRTSIYSGYGDTGKGFFKVYADIFERLFHEEIAYAHSMGTGPVNEAPPIGNLESPYTQVSAFYNYWLRFSTVKDFSWVGEVSAEQNLKTRRLRKAAKRKYNESVRRLARFVKKRDTRVLEWKLQRRKEEQKKAAQATARRETLEKEKEKVLRERLVKERQYGEQRERIDEEEVEDDRSRGSHDGWYADVKCKEGPEPLVLSGTGELYCILCCKKLKSDLQWKRHERSKKHRDGVARF